MTAITGRDSSPGGGLDDVLARVVAFKKDSSDIEKSNSPDPIIIMKGPGGCCLANPGP